MFVCLFLIIYLNSNKAFSQSKPSNCARMTKGGDQIRVNYEGHLNSVDGHVFDSSYTRNEAFEFTLGAGEVIKGQFVVFATAKTKNQNQTKKNPPSQKNSIFSLVLKYESFVV
jgi:hypothetical protein